MSTFQLCFVAGWILICLSMLSAGILSIKRKKIVSLIGNSKYGLNASTRVAIAHGVGWIISATSLLAVLAINLSGNAFLNGNLRNLVGWIFCIGGLAPSLVFPIVISTFETWTRDREMDHIKSK
ncbi:MAG: hypothetical protein L0154_02780 [Chloroflexi bacterium]|nr:hypothetical protein [Chloroflexota bacterium]